MKPVDSQQPAAFRIDVTVPVSNSNQVSRNANSSRCYSPTPLWMRVIVQLASFVGQTHRAVGFSIRSSLSDVLEKVKKGADPAIIEKSVSALNAALDLKIYLSGRYSSAVQVAVGETLDTLKPGLATMLRLHDIVVDGHGKDEFTWAYSSAY